MNDMQPLVLYDELSQMHPCRSSAGSDFWPFGGFSNVRTTGGDNNHCPEYSCPLLGFAIIKTSALREVEMQAIVGRETSFEVSAGSPGFWPSEGGAATVTR